jgi:hypothetical protein
MHKVLIVEYKNPDADFEDDIYYEDLYAVYIDNCFISDFGEEEDRSICLAKNIAKVWGIEPIRLTAPDAMKATEFVTDYLAKSISPIAGLCTKCGRVPIDLVTGSGRKGAYFGHCKECKEKG